LFNKIAKYYKGIDTVSSVLYAVQQYEFDVALVSAGIPANLTNDIIGG
jgi:hypothetical protein